MLYLFLKRTMDIAFSIFGLVITAPLFFIIPVLIKLDSKGPVFYKRKALKKGGKVFNSLKFRSMVKDADRILANNGQLRMEYEKNYKLEDDPRVTNLGRFLRRTKLDELPQLINVLKGEMSLVGPRMISPEELKKYGGFAHKFLSVKPALFGPWQLSKTQDYQERVKFDMEYVDNKSIVVDLGIILKFLSAMLKGDSCTR